jgi:ABC-type Fe3+ transport system substrate-binding protein
MEATPLNTLLHPRWLCPIATAAGFAIAIGASATPLDDLVRSARRAGDVTWYENSPTDQADNVIAAFNKKYPDVKVKQVRIVGGSELAARSIQEIQGRGYTGDVLTGGADHIWQLNERGYLEKVDWAKYGVPKSVTPTPFAMATTASVYVISWNDKKVKEMEAPKTWAEVADPKWAGRTGSWVRASAFAQLASAWGVPKAQALLTSYVKLKPLLFKSTYSLAQALGSGEIDIGIGFYHSTVPRIESGAPIKYKVLDPVPMHTIYSGVSKNAKNPDGAKLLLAWLASDEGALAYEAATSRGNPLIAATKIGQLVKGKKLVEYPPDQAEAFNKVSDDFNKLLEAGAGGR